VGDVVLGSCLRGAGPLFLIAAVVAFLMEARLWDVNEDALWGLIVMGVGLAFLIEWRMVGRQGARDQGA
jgi:hypothetical protein